MTYTATISSKGQLVIPSALRERFGLNNPNQKVIMNFNPDNNSIVLTKPRDMEEVSAMLLKKIKAKKIKPLMNPRAFYESRRVLEKYYK